ncbi:flagellar type III secretion system protein FliR [Campylobacter sp. VicNov18]|uniref:flagellar biosynthetic protein FliR n=1 Tax=Campylobacter bilis TaxID=2691918 RepID=UPI00130E9639|nr:flagellar biosynthetic protein FliR [Campylobacter bilis]MPV63191.1 flagellar type III secretion system protein FliR [Campylobacter hepaticus]MBM0636691.1 flagellar type III secretion system protein FliR [Campylobacter bilis]MCC8277535.1 flagellar type III secretion system protein FliR [Campylobacter bilis]MCC8298740.1 flagellar type III secretion system protein FliR [Campylobacter bilis]MCC8300444.1 flagellar type III secretion system protein FliR [Campylobacter bilis]
MEFINYLGDKNVVTFMLLFARMSGLMVFFPFFSHNSIPVIIKSTLVLFLTIYLYPLAKLESLHLDSFFILQLISEVVFGMIAGLMLQIIFVILMMAGEQIAFTMGFTIANVLDPSLGIAMPITAQILNLLALIFFLAFDGHHLMLLFLSHSLGYINLGGFYLHENLMHYLNIGMLNIFIIGFTMSFPILAISLLADVVFGILMKTMPQFNLLVIGYPVKIAIGFVVLMAILLVMMQYFKNLILEVLTHMQTLFFS